MYAKTKQSSVLSDDGPLVRHGNAMFPSILEPRKHGYIKPSCTSRPSA